MDTGKHSVLRQQPINLKHPSRPATLKGHALKSYTANRISLPADRMGRTLRTTVPEDELDSSVELGISGLNPREQS